MNESGQRFLDELVEHVLIGDGAMGTELFARGATPEQGVERLNLLAPDIVRDLHREYIAAGSRVIETNTFAADRHHLTRYGAPGDSRSVVLAGARIAREAAGPDVYVAGSMGPLPMIEGEPLPDSDRDAAFAEVIGALIEGGADILLFETFVSLDDLESAIRVARALTDMPVIAQMAFERGGRTAGGNTAEEFCRRVTAAGANIVGANCGAGVPAVVSAVRQLGCGGAPVSAYMNAGYPERIEDRQLYLATPEYLARRAVELADLGARLIGGCCGTSPETIRAIARELSGHAMGRTVIQGRDGLIRPFRESAPAVRPVEGPTVPSGLLVELDPPRNLDMKSLLASAHTLRDAGVATVTVADNPLATASADALTVAGVLAREAGLDVLPHLTGRDRNRIALQSYVIAAHLLGIRSILCITGDPVRMYHEDNTSGVFDLTSIGLVKLVAEFNEGRRAEGDRTQFSIGVALNPNVRMLEGQIRKLQRKIDAGAHFALTQPMFEIGRFHRFREELDRAGIGIPVFPGILPLRSAKNADFLHYEVPGIAIPDELRARLWKYDSPDDQRKAGLDIAVEFIEAFAPGSRGIYLIAPRNRVELVLPVVKATRRLLPIESPAG